MEPKILHQVIHGKTDPESWQKALVSVKPAVLRGYRRYAIKGCDYPAILQDEGPGNSTISANKSTGGGRTSCCDHRTPSCVLGTLVSGLTYGDIHRLDLFEGDEYEKRTVKVHVLRNTSPDEQLENDVIAHLAHVWPVLDAADAGETDDVEALTYVWVAGAENLQCNEWDFEFFRRKKLDQWLREDPSRW